MAAGEALPLRVLHLCLWMTPTGMGTQTWLRCLLAALEGAENVRSFGAAVNPGQAPPGFSAPVRLGSTGAGGWRNALAFGRHVWRVARDMDVVQIHGLNGPQFLLGAPLCWLLGVPYIVTPLNGLAPWMLEQKALKKRLFYSTVGGFFLRKAACVLATSAPEAEALKLRFPRAATRLVLVGVDVPAQPTVGLLGESTSELRLLYLGAFDRWKRVPMLVRAVAALRQAGIDARATIGGKGPPALEQTVADEIARLGVADAVTMAGYVAGDRKAVLLRSSHLLVLPSVTDSYSLATAEALAQGLPVVITEGAGAAPDVREHRCGTVIAIDDEAALVAALRRYTDRALLREHALNAHRYARAVLDLSVLRAGMTALYRELRRTQAS